ncbi:MAG: 50S ribosomal protein L10 [Rhodospirillaceae bacterium]|nr:50S ribosomal protein L10 [Rhodospirillaceae bacterium]
MDRARKEELVTELNQSFAEAALVVVTQQTGLTVSESTELRGKMREAGASYKVTKNRLAKLALAGTPYEPITDLFSGPTAIAYSADPVAAARVAVDFAKENDKLVVVGGAMGGTLLDENAVKALASLPSLDELRGKLVGLLNAPATKIAGVLQAPAGQLARVTGAYANQDEAA